MFSFPSNSQSDVPQEDQGTNSYPTPPKNCVSETCMSILTFSLINDAIFRGSTFTAGSSTECAQTLKCLSIGTPNPTTFQFVPNGK